MSGDPSRDAAAADARLAALLAAVPEPMLAVDGGDRVAAFNPPALALLPALRVGAPLALNLRAPGVLDAVAEARTGVGTVRAHWSERAPVERVFAVSATAAAGLDDAPLVVLHLHEVSEERRFERMRVDFVANASHELRTPLASLIGFIETLQGPARNDEAARARFLAIMREQARRMARLVDDLLSLSRIEQHLHLQPRDPVDLNPLLRHIGDTLTPLAADSGVTLDFAVAGRLLVAGDRDELMRVAENLVENAVKYAASGGRVAVEARREGREAVVAVRDFGEGIAPEHLPRLTERFYRVDAGQSRAKGGTGLGLAIVKHVVARHRGRLKIESRQGEGSTFRVFLPLHPADAPS